MALVIGYVYGYMWSEGEVLPYEFVDAGIYNTSPYRRMNINLHCTPYSTWNAVEWSCGLIGLFYPSFYPPRLILMPAYSPRYSAFWTRPSDASSLA